MHDPTAHVLSFPQRQNGQILDARLWLRYLLQKPDFAGAINMVTYKKQQLIGLAQPQVSES